MNHKAKAIQLLGEKITKKLDDTHMKSATYPNGYNQMHSKAVGVVMRLLERIKESGEQRLNDKESIAGLTKSCKEAITELQSIKETHKNIIDEKCAGDELHCTCVPALRERITNLDKLSKYLSGKFREKDQELQSAKERIEALAEGHADLNDRLNEVGKENETLKQKYQELKDKLTVENMDKFLKKYKSHCERISNKTGFFYCKGCRDDFYQALIEELKSTNDK